MTAHSDPNIRHPLLAEDESQQSESVNLTETEIPEVDEHGYRIKEQPLGTRRHVKIVMMGAGASSLNFFKKAEERLQDVQIVCYEKNHDIGGTWLENRYPGCACDIPSVNYQFSWKIQTWPHYYSYSHEIWRYLKDIAEENNFVAKYVKLKHQIERAEWDDEVGLWRFKVRNLDTGNIFDDAAEFFINAGGVLNNWKWPDIPDLMAFSGKLMHSADYEAGYDLRGKKVAVIGAGSSGVQIVAAIQPEVEILHHWVKSPIWITAGFAQTWAGRDGANFKYSEEQLQFLQDHPKKYLEYRKQVENELNQRFKFIIKGSEEARSARSFTEKDMKRKLRDDPRLVEKIVPKTFNIGCRRPTPAPGYLQALVERNVTVHTDPINRITPKGFVDHENNEHEVDVIICATGFDTSWLPRFPLIAYGRDLRDIWRATDGSADVTSYLSIGIPNFPNHFTFCGAYGPLGHGSFMPLIEHWTRYMFSVIEKVQIEGIKSVRPKEKPARDFRQHADLFLKRTAWTMPCKSWFKQGKISGQAAMYPGSRLHFFNLLASPRYEDFTIEYQDDNMFSFLGNGFDTREFDGRDITYYLGSLNDEGRDIQPEYDETLIEKLAGWGIGREYEARGTSYFVPEH